MSRERLVRNEASIFVPRTEEIIYYPVIHNTIIMNRDKGHSFTGTPARKSKRVLLTEGDEGILTPTQFK